MNLKIRNQIFFGILLLSFGSYTYSQINVFEPLEHYTDPSVIQKNNIKSLIVTAEMKKSDNDDTVVEFGNVCELEYNKAGYPAYKISYDIENNFPFVYYEPRWIFLLFKYDQNNRLISRYIENKERSLTEVKAYNFQGNLSSLQYIVGKDTAYKIVFEWLGNKMVKATIENADILNSNRIDKYDQQGRITESKSNERLVNVKYEQKMETLITTTSTYISDTLFSTQIQKTLLKNNLTISYVKMDHVGKLAIEMNATFDKNRNATYYYLNYVDRYPLFSYTIQNFYDNRNLLSERKFYLSMGTEPDIFKIGPKIEHYFFNSDTLSRKLTEGTFIDRQGSEHLTCDDAGACEDAH
jgi:hypothetical protein